MRFVIFGAGAIGGVIGARLYQAGADVHLIARGDHHDAIAQRGLTLETPTERVTLRIPVSPTPTDVGLRPDDTVILAVKGQDSWGALTALQDAAPHGIAVVCAQNGVENERVALRLFPDVYGAVVMSPTAHLEAGYVQAYGTQMTGAIDVGRYPRGTDERCVEISAALASARFESEPRDDIMRYKNAKLIANLANAIEAVCGSGAPGSDELAQRVRTEGRAVLSAAGIACDADEVADLPSRWRRWGVGEIDRRPRGGGSTWQSVVRGTGEVESDLLNGEIVLQGRLHNRPAPVNELLQSLARETAREGRQPGWLSTGEVLARLPGAV